MLSEDVRLLFKGFEPTHDVRSMIDILLNELHLKAPSQSFLSATFTLTNGIFEGAIKITSSAENFAVKAADATLNGLRKQLFEKLGTQLKDWKKIRFDPKP
jgi:hypothetical protein